ncbi:MAG: helix-turn-helix domain-containing protein [Nocardioides sp.]
MISMAASGGVRGAGGAPFYSVAEFARALGVGEMTVYRAIHAGRLPAVKFGGRYLVPARVLEELIESAMATGSLVDVADQLDPADGVA